jgi:hypothetical protein
MNIRTNPAHVTSEKKKRGACNYSQLDPHPSFLRGSAWERVWLLVQGACGAWGTVHVRDHGERLPAASRTRPGPRPAATCHPALFSVCVVCTQAKLLCRMLPAALQGWLDRLLVCERSACPHLHASLLLS